MALNRTIYLTALSGAVAFFLASDVWFAWALLFLLLLLPPISLLCSLPQLLYLRLSLSAPESVEQGERLLLWVGVKALRALPMPELRIQLRVSDGAFAPPKKHYLSRIPRQGGTVWLETERAGLLQCRAVRVRAYDYLGLIWLPRRKPLPTETAVLPAPRAPEPLPDLSIFASRRLTQLPQGSFSELHDYRPYRDGDNLRAVHWKLSQKTDEFIVREPVEPVRLRCCVLVLSPRDPEELESQLAQLRWICRWLIGQGIAHEVLWRGRSGLRIAAVASEEDALRVLIEACGMPRFDAPPALPEPEAEWICRIVPGREAPI